MRPRTNLVRERAKEETASVCPSVSSSSSWEWPTATSTRMMAAASAAAQRLSGKDTEKLYEKLRAQQQQQWKINGSGNRLRDGVDTVPHISYGISLYNSFIFCISGKTRVDS